ncbi:SMP-30/gluconolactonase/LRE family protein [Sphingomonas crocodyli]|uniref:SMP-30/gluconolactonase/LRE family protein n=1 Tax=Sphingomonas crocodyli TaxID=1979270 RepID=A0A437M5Y2_9SPHN|nr:SMP-30/gluconolactonase/LRE family protein [Sphingomonas crocodyli]RVT93118.1 SMP-30/gluconolactonase/LRE family protein [Sphingomonas crocodyli]
MPAIRVLVDCENQLGECPVWDGPAERLYWVDSIAGEIWRCAADGSDLARWTLPAAIGSMALRAGGGAIVALETGLHLFDFETGALSLVAHPEAGLDDVRLNDGAVDSRGRLVIGSLDMGTIDDPVETRDPRGSLWRLDPDLSLHRLADGVSIGNGPCWSPDGRLFYFTDTNVSTIFVYDWDAEQGTATGRRALVIAEPEEMPDGCVLDTEGYLWSVFNGPYTGLGQVRRYAPDGRLDRTIKMPMPRPTSLAFGGPDLDILFVTSMTIPSAVPSTDLDGRLFAISGLGVRGLPEPRFAG